MYRISGFEGGVEEERCILRNKKRLAFESPGMSCIIGKGWPGGLKISSRMTFDQPSVGRAFSYVHSR